jgi:hypothetical protein
MRKRVTREHAWHDSVADRNWLDLSQLAQVEVTSEDLAHPIDAALLPAAGSGWRAAQPGEQIIRLLFDEPQQVSCIQLLFHEDKQARTQEFLLRCLQDKHQSYREIVRQQHHFSPPGTIRELEEYAVDLADVLVLELKIVPDITGGAAHASIVRFRVG